MAEAAEASPWLAVIGKSLAYLCLEKARERDAKKFEDVLTKVDFLQALGVPEREAAAAAGTSIESVRVLRHHHGRKKSNGKKARKKSRR